MQPGLKLAGRYALQARLGHGGMGEVWRGVDERLGRPVAVKVLGEHLADPERLARFRREAELTARLQHPGITVVHDVGSDNGQPFIVMELLHGRDLAAMLAQAPCGLPIDAALTLAVQAAEALQAAHAGHVIHRDLKPANLFVLDSGQLKICDFGIAWAVDATTHLTPTGQAFGTPAYMSPEQCRGEHVDERSDLYSLGCVLYELLTGRRPFAGGWPLAIIFQHLNAVAADPRTIRPEIPQELDDLVLDLLAKDPARRPAGAGQVIAALRTLWHPPTVKVEPAPHYSARVAERNGEIRQRRRAEQLLSDAEQVARTTIDEGYRVYMMAKVATAWLAVDLGRASQLLQDAEQVAYAIKDESHRNSALGAVAQATANTDSVRAEQIAQTIGIHEARTQTLVGVVKVVATIDPVRAEQIARAIPENFYGVRAEALAAVAKAWIGVDVSRVRQIARAIMDSHAEPDFGHRASSLTDVAKALIDADPALAERLLDEAAEIARALDEQYVGGHRTKQLTAIAKAYVLIDRTHTEQLLREAEHRARNLPKDRDQAEALASVVEGWADIDPARAEQMARTISGYTKARALAISARAWARTDCARAEQIARAITDAGQRDWALLWVAEALASKDSAQAEQIARAITDAKQRDSALARLAKTIAGTNSRHAEKIARTINRAYYGYAKALAWIARAVADSDAARAAQLLDEAEHTACSAPYTSAQEKPYALSEVAKVWAHIDPARSAQIARTITYALAREEVVREMLSIADEWRQRKS